MLIKNTNKNVKNPCRKIVTVMKKTPKKKNVFIEVFIKTFFLCFFHVTISRRGFFKFLIMFCLCLFLILLVNALHLFKY